MQRAWVLPRRVPAYAFVRAFAVYPWPFPPSSSFEESKLELEADSMWTDSARLDPLSSMSSPVWDKWTGISCIGGI